MFRCLIMGLLLCFGTFTKAAVWTEVNEWSPEFENRFAEWVRTEWRTDFFSRQLLPNGQSNPYYGLHVDCADTVYSMRIVFSYENKLPFLAQDPTELGKTISNKMKRWDGQSEAERVRRFLVYIYGVMSTASLPNDTYPVAIHRDAARAGGVILTTKKNHHSWSIKEILPIGVPHLVYNSVVGSSSGLSLQQRQSWPNPEWVFETNFTPAGHAGLRYWRQPKDINRPVWDVPGYSEEQYKLPLKNWVRQVQSRLAVNTETDEQHLLRLVKTACEGLQGRVVTIQEGAAYLKSNSGCMDYPTYDTYSTPNRDRRIFDDLIVLRRTYRDILSHNSGSELSPSLKEQMNKLFPQITQSVATEARQMTPQTVDGNSVCVTQYWSEQSMDLAEFKRRLFLGLISHNPHDEAAYRWGDLRGPSQRAKRCQSWDPWTPDLSQE